MDENDIEEARKILGSIAQDFSDEELRDEYTKIQYLIETWLDDYEKSIFGGKTLRELLG